MRGGAWLLCLLLSGCIGSCEDVVDDGPPPDPHVRYEPDEEYWVTHFGKPFTVTAYLTNDDGSPATGYTWEWMHADAIESTPWDLSNARNVGPGVEELTFTPPIYAVSQIWGRYHVCGRHKDNDCFYDTTNDSLKMDVVVWGGPAVDVYAAFDQASILVGEKRSIGAVSIAYQRNTRRYSDDPVTYSSSSPSIASVDEHGVVTGVTTGDATITASAGSGSKDIAIHVVAGTPTAIPDGLVPLIEKRKEWQLWPGLLFSFKAAGYDMAMSPGVGPYVIANMITSDGTDLGKTVIDSRSGGGDYGPSTLAQWSGSGFGYQVPGEPYDLQIDPMVALDERDKLYTVYRSGNRRAWVVLERDASAPPGTERMRQLTNELDEPKSLGARPREYVITTNPDLQNSAIVPRDGGGLWVAYTVYADMAWNSSTIVDEIYGDVIKRPCAYAGFLAEVTDAGITTRQLFTHWYFPDPVEGCLGGDTANIDPNRGPKEFLELTRNPNGGTPGTHFNEYNDAFQPLDTPSVMSTPEWQAEGGRPELGSHGGLGGFLVGDQRFFVTKDGAGWKGPQHAPPGGPDATISVGDIWDELGLFTVFTPLIDLERTIRGWTHTDTRFSAFMVGGELPTTAFTVATVRLPRSVRWQDDEIAGRRFSNDVEAPGIIDPPVITPSGARIWYSRGYGTCYGDPAPSATGLWTSTGPGARPQMITPNGLLTLHPVQGVGSDLYGIISDASGSLFGFTVRRSTDGGANWTVASSYHGQASNTQVRAFRTLPGGGAFVLMAVDLVTQNFQILYTANVATGPWIELPGFSGAQLGTYTTMSTERETFGLVPDGTGNMWVVVSTHSTQNGVLARKYSPTGVLLDEELAVAPPRAAGAVIPLASTATIAGNGRIVVLVRETSPAGYRLDSIAINTTTSVVTPGTLATDAVGRVVQLVTMPNGKVVAGIQVSSPLGSPAYGYTRYRDRAMLLSTTDGSTWSAPALLRPNGGNGQFVASLWLDSDGTLATVVSDNGSWGATGLILDEYMIRIGGIACFGAKHPGAIMRVTPP